MSSPDNRSITPDVAKEQQRQGILDEIEKVRASGDIKWGHRYFANFVGNLPVSDAYARFPHVRGMYTQMGALDQPFSQQPSNPNMSPRKLSQTPRQFFETIDQVVEKYFAPPSSDTFDERQLAATASFHDESLLSFIKDDVLKEDGSINAIETVKSLYEGYVESLQESSLLGDAALDNLYYRLRYVYASLIVDEEYTFEDLTT